MVEGVPVKRRTLRRRTLRRWAAPALGALALAAALIAVVRRGEEGRRLARELGAVEAEAHVMVDRIQTQRVRIDSLSARSRMQGAAGALGLRPVSDGEFVHVRGRAESAGEAAEEHRETSGSGGGGLR